MNDQIRAAEEDQEGPGYIPIHGPEEFEAMRVAGRLAAGDGKRLCVSVPPLH